MKKLFYIFLFLLIWQTSCTDADDNDLNPVDSSWVTLSLNMPAQHQVGLRGTRTATDPETDITRLDIIVVKAGEVKQHVMLGADDIVNTDNARLKKVRVKLNPLSDCNVYVYANATMLPAQVTDVGTLASLVVTGSSLPASPFMMGGEILNTSVSENLPLSVILNRMVAKITVENQMSDAEFNLNGFTLCNAPNRGQLTSTGNFSLPDNIEYKLTGQATAKGTLYSYESQARKSFLILSGKYKGESSDSYYKIEFHADAYLDLQRNHHYKVQLQKINVKGYSSADDAIKNPPANIVVNIVDQDLSTNSVATNGQYELAVTDKITVSATATQLENIRIMLNAAALFDITPISVSTTAIDSWITVSNVALIVTSDPTKNKEYKLDITFTTNPRDELRTGRIQVVAGNLSRIITIEQEPINFIRQRNILSNGFPYWQMIDNYKGLGGRDNGLHFYMFSNWISYEIPIDNAAEVNIENPTPDKFKVFLQDNKVIVKLSENQISEDPWISEFTLTFTSGGNIVRREHYPVYRTGIFYGEEGTFSVTAIPERYPYYLEVVKVGDDYWLDRNLGATSNGFYSPFGDEGDRDRESIGGYYRIKDAANVTQDILKICPEGFTVPSRSQFEELEKSPYWNVEKKLNRDGSTYWVPTITSSQPDAPLHKIYLPMGGSMVNGRLSGNSGGYYWTSSYAFEKQEIPFNNLTEEQKYWQSAVNILSSNMQFISDRFVMVGGQYKGMSVRCVRKK